MPKDSGQQTQNKEMEILGTHAAGATDLFEQRKAAEGESVKPPKHPGGAGSSGTY
ncbi:hypothetical protein [Brevibacillus choshinensis]|uniref:Uncharacterized protein n=1 Tax=Brevibacillus choshinensis TaxID=54911 RepID=A0ABX7FX51_BRECH|nr:hypothetical protein [Brevibacillus choshinensis]QRG70377.1 hypothetical protein JNE38_15450 [Brevibacillus choshinensis]